MRAVDHTRPILNIGMLGSGFMGKMRSHAFSVVPTIYEDIHVKPILYALASLDDEVEAFASRFGYSYYTTDWREVVEDPEVDIVMVCTPEHLHEEMSVAALVAGKHVFCEKALSLTVASCLNMVAVAKNATGKNMCGFNYRFLPAIQLARQLILKDIIGDIYYVDCRYFQEAGHDPTRPAEEVTYAYGNNPLGSAKGLGSHAIDTVRFLAGDMLSVNGLYKTFVPRRKTLAGEAYEVKTDDFANMTVEFASGAIGYIATSKISTGRKNQMKFEINGSKGSLQFDVETPNILEVYLDDTTIPELKGFTRVNVTEKSHPLMEYWWPPAHNLGWEHSHINELKHLVECITENKSIGPIGGTFEDGLNAVRITEIALQSSLEGCRRMLPSREDIL